MSGFDPGRIEVLRSPREGHPATISLRCLRPDGARLMRGRSASEVATLMPMIYSLCGHAQGAAARLALEAARTGSPARESNAGILAEAVREHAWRLLLDWPPLLGLPPDEAGFASLVARFNAGERFQWPLPSWVDQLPVEGLSGPLLPTLDAQASLREWPILDAGFSSQPRWRGAAAETGAWGRRPMLDGQGIRSRVLARALELHDCLKGEASTLGQASAAAVAPGRGRAVVETARGPLMHEAALQGDLVADYVVVAPTEWNFAADGALQSNLAAIHEDNDEAFRQRAALWLMAFDPCVPWRLK